jgi:ribose-phosphate pyrophosphokinase
MGHSITHPVLLPTAPETLGRDYISELIASDTIWLPPEKRHPRIGVQSIAYLLTEGIRRNRVGETISPLLRLL